MDLEPFRKRYGRFRVEHRDWPVDAEEFARFTARGREPTGAAVLLWDSERRILLVRERSKAGKQGNWATPGGFAEARESPEDCVEREAQEEAGVRVRITGLTKVVLCHVSDGSHQCDFTFFQFEGALAGGTPKPGKGVEAVAWFDRLPNELHFRADYVEPWRLGRPFL